mmetsp:Transcript_874/g.2018  ORF Transcript_874/g.2018 Transcript_874/m.2018 type:complete len:217 (+) Transcript_874:1883-2533(+)
MCIIVLKKPLKQQFLDEVLAQFALIILELFSPPFHNLEILSQCVNQFTNRFLGRVFDLFLFEFLTLFLIFSQLPTPFLDLNLILTKLVVIFRYFMGKFRVNAQKTTVCTDGIVFFLVLSIKFFDFSLFVFQLLFQFLIQLLTTIFFKQFYTQLPASTAVIIPHPIEPNWKREKPGVENRDGEEEDTHDHLCPSKLFRKFTVCHRTTIRPRHCCFVS